MTSICYNIMPALAAKGIVDVETSARTVMSPPSEKHEYKIKT